MEIERKFLVDKNNLPDLSNVEKKYIRQGYLSFDPVVRLRKINSCYLLTQKGSGTLVREEKNIYITSYIADVLKYAIQGRIIEKERFLIPLPNNLVAELDFYQKEFEGFITVEVEFPSVEASQGFVIPDWFQEEITEDSRYHNDQLAQAEDLSFLFSSPTRKREL